MSGVDLLRVMLGVGYWAPCLPGAFIGVDMRDVYRSPKGIYISIKSQKYWAKYDGFFCVRTVYMMSRALYGKCLVDTPGRVVLPVEVEVWDGCTAFD